MKICLISHSAYLNGAELALLELVDVLTQHNIDTAVVVPSKGPLYSELQARNVETYVVAYFSWVGSEAIFWKRLARILLNVITVFPLALTLLKSDCTIVLSNTLTLGVGALAARMLRKPHVLYIHELGKREHGIYFDLGRNFTLRLLSRLSDVWIANSKTTKKELSRFADPDQIVVVYQPVVTTNTRTARQEHPEMVHQSSKCFKCINIGTLHPGKRQEDAIRAVATLVSLGFNVELVLVGDGFSKYKNDLKAVTKESGIEANVRFTGYVSNPVSLINTADVLLVCSTNEAFGRVTIEGMLAGKPVIGARSGATTELIKEGVNGLLYTPGDYKELSEKIRYLYENPEAKTQLGSNGQAWSTSTFDQHRYGKSVLHLLKKIELERMSS